MLYIGNEYEIKDNFSAQAEFLVHLLKQGEWSVKNSGV